MTLLAELRMPEHDFVRTDRHARLPIGVSPTRWPSIHTSAHGAAFRLTTPFGRSIARRDLAGRHLDDARDAIAERFVDELESCRPAAIITRSASVVPRRRPSSRISSVNGALTVSHPDTGPAGRRRATGATSDAVPPACTLTMWRADAIGVCRTTS